MNWRRGLLIALLPTLAYLGLAEVAYRLYDWGHMLSSGYAGVAVVVGLLSVLVLAYPGMFLAEVLNIYEWPTYFGYSPLERAGVESSFERTHVWFAITAVVVYGSVAVFVAAVSRRRPENQRRLRDPAA